MECKICPRKCGKNSFCGKGELCVIANYGLHHWEEPCISGDNGSGAIFFSGCNLRCEFCQNFKISRKIKGKAVTVNELKQIYSELIALGAHNINLVTPTIYSDIILESLTPKPPVPVVYNCGGYENCETLKKLNGVVDIYLPDFKYSDNDLAMRLSNAKNYKETALSAIKEMFSQVGKPVFDEFGILKKGVLIRHLILPNNLKNTFGVLEIISENFKDGDILFSLMSQFTPNGNGELTRKITLREYKRAFDFMLRSGFIEVYTQDIESSDGEYVPKWNFEE